MHDPFLLLVGVGVVSIICQFIAYKVKLPAILPLLIAGILLGPTTGVLDPDQLFGELLFPIISLSVAIILFEGSLTLNLKDLSGHGAMVRNLCSIGAVITWLVVTPVTHFALGLGWELSFLFGAFVTVTGPTVIKPMLRTVRPSSKIAQILHWEGIIIDPIGALIAVIVYTYIISAQQHALSTTLTTFGFTVLVGTVSGVVGGYLLGLALRQNLIPPYLTNPAVLTLMLGVFALSNTLAHESGLLTVTIMGMWLANMKHVEIDEILEFKETLSVLLISALFILLAARLDFHSIVEVGAGAIIVLIAILFIVRPLSVFASSFGTGLNLKEKLLLSWIAPRGIVAAAVSALFALKLDEFGYEASSVLVPMVFLVIITTVVVQSLSAAWLAKWLGLRSPAPHGILIFGANEFARRFAKELIDKGATVRLADTNWDAIRLARMDNIPVYYGNPASDHAHRHFDISAYGKVLILSPYRQLNAIITYHFEAELGKNTVLGLNWGDSESRSSHQLSEDYYQKLGLFSEDVTYAKLSGLIARGSSIKTTTISDAFPYEEYLKTYQDRAIPLCALNPQGRVFMFTRNNTFTPKADWQIMSLVQPDPSDVKAAAAKPATERKLPDQKKDSGTGQPATS